MRPTKRRPTAIMALVTGSAATALALWGAAGHPGIADRPALAASRSSKDVVIGGVRWRASLEQARERAARENKPVVLLNLFGRLDQEFC